MEKKIFGLTPDEIRRQGRDTHEVDPQYKMSPINPEAGFLEPCIDGAKKILEDPQKKEMFYRIYRGKN